MTSEPDDRPATATPPPTKLQFDLLNVALATAVVLLVIQAFTFIDLVRHVLLVCILAILLATAIQPLVARLHRSGLGRGPSVLGIYLVVVTIVVAFFLFVGQAVAAQASSLVADLPGLSARLGTLVAALPAGLLRDSASQLLNGLNADVLGQLVSSSVTTGALASLVSVTLTVFETAFTIITVFVIAYFWLAERLAIRRLLIRPVRAEYRSKVLTIWEDVEGKLGAWMRGELLLMLIIGTAQGIGYVALGLPFALLLAVFAGLAEAIPMVGPYLGAIPAILVALTISPSTALVLVGYTVVLHLVESNVLVPKVMNRAVGLTALTVILALLVGAAVGGLIGALLAIPIAAAIQVVVVDLVRTPKDLEGPEEGSASPPAESAA